MGLMKHSEVIVAAFTLLVVIQTSSLAASTSPSGFIKDFDNYMRVCQRIGCEQKKGCSPSGGVVGFHAALKSNLRNLPVNTILKFEDVLLNKGNGYDPKTGVFTAPVKGVYFFEWTFITFKEHTVYIEAVVNGVRKASTCIKKEASEHTSASGHLLYELKAGDKVWIRTFYVKAGYLHADKYTFFSGHKL